MKPAIVQISDIAESDPDQDLITRMRAGDTSALSALMDRHIDKIQALATRMLGDVFMAEDVTQTVFLKTWQQSTDWQPGRARLLTWMRRVATNQCLDVLKKKRPIYSDSPPDITDNRQDAFDRLNETDRRKLVYDALQQLSDRQRAALVLSYYDNVSQREGAKIMNLSEAAYESLLVRARRKLKTIIWTSGNADNLEALL